MDLTAIGQASRHECSAILAAVASRLVALDSEAVDQVDERVLDVPEAAAMLGVSVAACYKLAQTTYRELRIDNGTRSVKFSAAKIAAYLRRGDRRDAGSTSPIASGRRGVSRIRALTGPSVGSSTSRAPEPGGH